MSVAVISYSSLKDASREAGDVAKRMGQYADEIKSAVYKRLNKYDGAYTGNIASACQGTQAKMRELEDNKTRYQTYASNLISLKEQCESTDRSVKISVSNLTAEFKANYGIRNNMVENAIHAVMTGLKNSTFIGRFFSTVDDFHDTGRDFLKNCIKEWYEYGGGEEWLKGTAIAILEIGLAVVGIAAAIATIIGGAVGFALVAAVAGIIAGVIGVFNGIFNLIYEGRAYVETQNKNPAMGVRMRDVDKLSDAIRFETDNKWAHAYAAYLDVLEFVCNVIDIAGGITDFAKNAYKWATGSLVATDGIKLAEVFSKDGFSSIWSKLKTTSIDGISDLGNALREGNWSVIKSGVSSFGTSFMDNLKGNFGIAHIDNLPKLDAFKESLDVAKNWLNLGKDILEIDGIWGIGRTAIKDIVLPSIQFGEYKTGTLIRDGNIWEQGTKTDNVVNLGDIWELKDRLVDDIKEPFEDLTEVLKKLAESIATSVSIPENYFPRIVLAA